MSRASLFLALLLPLAACQSSPETEPVEEPPAVEDATVSTPEEADTASAEPASAPGTPLNLNTATEADFEALVGERMAHEFVEYRPYASIREFRRQIGKYVDEEQVAGYEDLVFVPVDPNASDEETLMQLPGVDAEMAAQLVTGRPYADEVGFLSAVAQLTGSSPVAASRYLAR